MVTWRDAEPVVFSEYDGLVATRGARWQGSVIDPFLWSCTFFANGSSGVGRCPSDTANDGIGQADTCEDVPNPAGCDTIGIAGRSMLSWLQVGK